MLENTEELGLAGAPLGEKSAYIVEYAPELLFPLPRKGKRDEINVPFPLPFFGYDTWNAYELSWLNNRGKPMVAIMVAHFSCESINIIESKSFKLYLNSFNNSRFSSRQAVEKFIQNDISLAAEGDVKISLYDLDHFTGERLASFSGECIDGLDIEIADYKVSSDLLLVDKGHVIEERVCSHLLKSNCLVTGQPDWGSVELHYKGPKVDRESLLRYIVSFRNHNEFHEQCVERIFMDILKLSNPEILTVEARYTRRGGLDINPVRSTEKTPPRENIRMARQ